jgi:hypothetical protein
MAKANLNKAHQVLTYLVLLFFSTILSWLLTKLAEVSHYLMRQWEWNHLCLAVCHHPRKHRKKKKARRPSKNKDQVQRKRSLTPTYLLPLALIAFKVGCCVMHFLRHLKAALTIECLPELVVFSAATNLPFQVPRIHFDTNSFVIGINTFASITLETTQTPLRTSRCTVKRMTQKWKGLRGG